MDEPVAYGPARCADAARRTLALLDEYGLSRPALDAVRTRLEDAMSGPMDGVDLGRLLDDACQAMAEDLAGR